MNKIDDEEWLKKFIQEKLSQEEREWIQARLMNEPALRLLYVALNQLIDDTQHAHLKKVLSQLRTWEERLSKQEFGSTETEYIDSDLKELISKEIQFKNADRIHAGNTNNEVTLKSWKPWAVAATVTLLTFVYLFVITKQPPRPMDCLISISSFNCF
jgi:hypothetical protein